MSIGEMTSERKRGTPKKMAIKIKTPPKTKKVFSE